MLQPGVAIDGRYLLERELGSGTFGTVWRACDQHTGRTVAVKFLRPELASRGDIVERFARESRALATVTHPNVVSVIDQREWKQLRFFVMEHVDGETLANWLAAGQKHRRLPPLSEVWLVLEQVCRGVAAAHAQGIVHRDLKPANVILNYQASGEVIAKVADFGIAQLGGRQQTATGWLMGTREYMSPEQGLGHAAKVCAASDVFALAVMFVEALTGRLHPDDLAQETWWSASVRGHVSSALAKLASTRPDVPAAIWRGITRALAEEPSARPPHAEALRGELEVAWGTSAGGIANSSRRSVGPTGAWGTAQAGNAPPLASVFTAPSLVEPVPPEPSPSPRSAAPRLGVPAPMLAAVGALVFCGVVVAGVLVWGGGERGLSNTIAAPTSTTGALTGGESVAPRSQTDLAPPPPQALAAPPPSAPPRATALTTEGALDGPPVRPSSFAASSILRDARHTFLPDLAFDGTHMTAWNEGAEGPGIGEWIEARYSRRVTVRSVRAATGWNAISRHRVDLFTVNAHIARATLLLDGEEVATRNVAVDQREVDFEAVNRPARSVRIRVDDVWPGSQYNDLCISEVTIDARMR